MGMMKALAARQATATTSAAIIVESFMSVPLVLSCMFTQQFVRFTRLYVGHLVNLEGEVRVSK